MDVAQHRQSVQSVPSAVSPLPASPGGAPRGAGATGAEPLSGRAAVDPAAGWEARLDLAFARRAGRTRVQRAEHRGPLRVQRPFYPEQDGTCHLYLLHPPGGVVGGDRLHTTARTEEGAATLLTSPGAAKLYRSGFHFAESRGSGAAEAGPPRQAEIRQGFSQAPGSQLEWLPQETIAFSGARARISTRVELEGDASFLGWDLLCLGRPHSGEAFAEGQVLQSLEILRDGVLCFRDVTRYEGGSPMLEAPWGMAGRSVVSTLVCAGAQQGWLETLREGLDGELLRELPDGAPGSYGGVTQIDDLLVVRLLSSTSREARRSLELCWSRLRQLQGRSAARPRIWDT